MAGATHLNSFKSMGGIDMKKLERISQGLVVVLLLSIVSIGGAQHEQGVWEERHAPMPTQRQYYSASAVNGKIYAIGGSVWNNGEPIRGRYLASLRNTTRRLTNYAERIWE